MADWMTSEQRYAWQIQLVAKLRALSGFSARGSACPEPRKTGSFLFLTVT
ncbi:hypothetical protein [Methylobacterium sp. Leaf456]|nr:hypothetical protein [Methylobacterium sp. Leaf456]